MILEYIHISLQLLAAVFVGALIGFERSYHGRPAGFRTHALVCIASSLLMMKRKRMLRLSVRASRSRLHEHRVHCLDVGIRLELAQGRD
jgi:uncharacterized membrane protein YhiD involved in acid resistance